ncbi:MAG: GH92 family glycosyl hydrolase [Tannerella sp.]|nr:GH92 family glycosyl hydrolase [Tannerella sp.]
MGTGANGGVTPVAALPFGMVQIGPDTRTCASGYHYDDDKILGFSHIHKSGAGCSDFLDILFLPLEENVDPIAIRELKRGQFYSMMDHQSESACPGYYSVDLYGGKIKAELTATLRCGVQSYLFKEKGSRALIIDLEHGSECGCSIVPEQDKDYILSSSIRKTDDRTIVGSRITTGFSPEQHVYFFTRFSHPVKEMFVFEDDKKMNNISSCTGKNIKAIVLFDESVEELEVKTGISPVDITGAGKNYTAEVSGKSFNEAKKFAYDEWNRILSAVDVVTDRQDVKELFYTNLFNVMLYPTLYSDVDFRYRGPDHQVHATDGFSYYGGVVGFWDTFRAAVPLQSVLQPGVTGEYVKTCLAHYEHFGQLPIWTLAGGETFQMIGLHSMPVITNAYMNGITDFDTDYAMTAMDVSAMKDTCGYSMNYFVGLENYKKLGYVPCDIEMESVARTLEYAYDDYAIARFAALTDNEDLAEYYDNRSKNYKNVIDTNTLFARGKTEAGLWRTSFDPLSSAHRRDDYCEGNAWQWTFFVPHDVDGLAGLFGGKKILAERLDALFTMGSALTGDLVSGDISGLIGQYAHGNEPSHHIIYMYNLLGEPEKTQYYVNKVLKTLYDTTPEGICGNEDTGQMSAWYVFSALGFYPMDPVSGRYELGAPLFEEATINLPSGKQFVIRTKNLSDTNIYVDKVFLNKKELDRTFITFNELLDGGELVFEMNDK